MGTASPESNRPASTLTARNIMREYAFWLREADFMRPILRDHPEAPHDTEGTRDIATVALTGICASV
ncbi:hypothetical protein GCM10022275_28970 [Tessaracoccus defluvii]